MIDDPLLPLAKCVRERDAVLFGAPGASMSVGLPLVKRMADGLGLEVDLDKRRGRFQTLAEYYRIKHGSIGPLRSRMDRHWTVSRDKIEKSELHHLIVTQDFPVIYTANYDRNLEVAFEIHSVEYVKVATARDVSKARRDVPYIVKFHGDFDDDSSLVLTETEYFDRLSFDTPLDVRFRSDALGSTVLFIGYSLSA